MVLTVNPQTYYDAARKLAAVADGIGVTVSRDLLPGIAGSGGMGGNYPAVAGWNTTYRGHAGDVRDAVGAYAKALTHFGDILNVAGYNWDTAEYHANSSKNKGAPPPIPALLAAAGLDGNGFPDIPDPNGDNGAGVLITSDGQNPSSWTGAPNGRADALAAAATAWHRFSSSGELTSASATLQNVHDSFDNIRAPEVPDIQEALLALRDGAMQIGSVAATLGDALDSHHANLLAARTQLAAAALGAFPSHPAVVVTTSEDNTSVRVSVSGADLSDVDIYNAEQVFNSTAQGSALFQELTATGTVASDFQFVDEMASLPKLKALTQLVPVRASGNQNDNTALVGELDRIATWDTPAAPLDEVNSAALDQYGPQMKNWAMLAVRYGNQAGVDPRLVLAMVLQEGAPLRTGLEQNLYHDLQDPSTYHPNPNGPEAGILWDQTRLTASGFGVSKHGAGDSIGLTNMKEHPFDEVTGTYPDQFQGAQWSDLVGNDDLAIKATAYNLRMLQDRAAAQASPEVMAGQPLDQFLGSGYNAGGTWQRSLGVAAQGQSFQPNEVEHGQSTLSVVQLADRILCGSGAYR
jgi:hypothetical protein